MIMALHVGRGELGSLGMSSIKAIMTYGFFRVIETEITTTTATNTMSKMIPTIMPNVIPTTIIKQCQDQNTGGGGGLYLSCSWLP